jgi:hypothetical protein
VTNKVILVIIAAALWANVFVKTSQPARADSDSLLIIEHDIHAVYNGTCLNSKLC